MMKFFDEWNLKSTATISVLAAFLWVFYMWPLWTDAENLYIHIFDNLDSAQVYYKILSESGMIFSDSGEIIPNMMSGIPRFGYYSEFNFLLLLYVLFDPLNAYVLNTTIIHLAAFMGMFILLRNTVLTGEDPWFRHLIATGLSLLFAFLPFWPPGGLSIAGMPLLLYIFLEFRSKRSLKWHWAFLLFIPFYSDFITVTVFFLSIIFIMTVHDTVINKMINRIVLFAMLTLGLEYFLINYRVAEAMLFTTDFVSHRTEFFRDFSPFFESFRFSHLLFLNGQEQSACYQSYYIVPVIVFAIVLSLYKHRLNKALSMVIIVLFSLSIYADSWLLLLGQRYSLLILIGLSVIACFLTDQKSVKILMLAFLLQMALSFWHGFWTYEGWIPLIETFELLRTFDFSRFYFLQPMLWFILLALAFRTLHHRLHYSPVLFFLIVFMQITLYFQTKTFLPPADREPLTYKTYYAEDVFNKAAEDIGVPRESYKIVSFGIQPAVALYNGFHTIDGYHVNYPLEYKHRFRTLLEKDFLEKPENQRIFDNWGSKCYLTGGVSYSRYHRGMLLEQIYFDTDALKTFNVKYLFSGYAIKNANSYGLQLLRSYVNVPSSYWDLFVYEVVSNR